MAMKTRPVVGLLPDREEACDDLLAQAFRSPARSAGRTLGGGDRQLDRDFEQLLLGAEVVVHEGRVHLGARGDVADRGSVVAALAELESRGEQDVLVGAALARAASAVTGVTA